MKKIMIASGLLALMAAATSCDKYDIYPEQYGDVMMIKDAGEKQVTIYATDDAAPYYISVMKGGHNPADEASATLRIMNEADFSKYKEKIYGDPEYKGLQYLKKEFYTLTSASDTKTPLEPREINYTFKGENDRYFGANVVLDAQKISDWRQAMQDRAEMPSNEADMKKKFPELTDAEIADLLVEQQMAADSLNNFTFVVPVGLYSSTDSVNADNFYVMVMPEVQDPVISVNVDHCGYQINEISRNELIENKEFVEGMYEPEVVFSIPCENPYGFKIRFDSSYSLIEDFNGVHSDIKLKSLPGAAYKLGTETEDGKLEKIIEFPAGVKEVRLPLSFVNAQMNPEDVTNSWAIGIQLKKSGKRYDINTGEPTTKPKNSIEADVIWDDAVPFKVKKSLKLPKPTEGSTPKSDTFLFYVGYKVVEMPLTLDDGCVTSNDCEPTEGSIAALFDDDLSTFFHSGWTVANDRSAPFGSYLEIEVPTRDLINACYFQFTARTGNNMPPKEVHLYYSNETDAQLRQLAENWTYIDKVVMKKNLGGGETGELGSLKDMVIAKEPYRYLRFCVIKNAKDQSLLIPSTANYWNLAELRVYGKYIDPASGE